MFVKDQLSQAIGVQKVALKLKVDSHHFVNHLKMTIRLVEQVRIGVKYLI